MKAWKSGLLVVVLILGGCANGDSDEINCGDIDSLIQEAIDRFIAENPGTDVPRENYEAVARNSLRESGYRECF